MRIRIALNTASDVRNFVNAVCAVPELVTVTDGNHFTVNAKSLMGMLYSLEFEELWCECEKDIYSHISVFAFD